MDGPKVLDQMLETKIILNANKVSTFTCKGVGYIDVIADLPSHSSTCWPISLVLLSDFTAPVLVFLQLISFSTKR